jgi:hypothetical protein
MMTALEGGKAMNKILMMALLAVMPLRAQAGEAAIAANLKADINMAAAVGRDIACHGPVALLVETRRRDQLTAELAPLVSGPLVMAGVGGVVVRGDGTLLAHLRASPLVTALYRIDGATALEAPAKPSAQALRARADKGAVPVIAVLPVGVAPLDLLATLAPFKPGNVKTFDLSPQVAMTVDSKGLDALLTSPLVCSVTEDAMNKPMMVK